MLAPNIRKFLTKFRKTPCHPQWFAFKNEAQKQRSVHNWASGRVLDIGCANQYISSYISPSVEYLSLDYYATAQEWYKTRPHVFGDAQRLPFKSSSMDSILLLDVLEHLPKPKTCLKEIVRVLKPEGVLILQVPFLYPLHDAPLDYHRWTKYGLRQLAFENKLEIKEEVFLGNPLETGALLFNVALSKIFLNWYRNNKIAIVVIPFVVLVIFLINVLCWLFTVISDDDGMMPHGYGLVLKKTICDTSS